MGPADVQTAGDALDDKTDGFTNEYVSKDLVFKKEVVGNKASRDKYFEFTAVVDNINDADVFVVSIADDGNEFTTDGDADATSGTTTATIAENRGKTNPTEVTGAQLKTGVKFYLQHGQSIAIRGIAPNATYAITENAEDYKSTASAVTNYTNPTQTNSDSVSAGNIGTIAGENKAVMTSYQNQRDGIIPTGVITKSLVIAAAAVILSAAFIACITASKRRRAK